MTDVVCQAGVGVGHQHQESDEHWYEVVELPCKGDLLTRDVEETAPKRTHTPGKEGRCFRC